MEAVQKMGKAPLRVYSDEEGSLNSGVVKEYLDKEGRNRNTFNQGTP